MARRKGPAGQRKGPSRTKAMTTHRKIRADELRARKRAGRQRWAVVLGLDLANKQWGGDDMLSQRERKGKA